MMIKLSMALGALVILAGTGGTRDLKNPSAVPWMVADEGSSPLATWGDSLPLDLRVSKEMLRFKGGNALSPAYAEVFTREVRSRVISSADARVSSLLSGTCDPLLDVTIGEWEFSDPFYEGIAGDLKKAIDNFEGSLIRTEMVACLQGARGQPGAALELYTGPAFRMTAEDRIQDMWDAPEGSCIETKGAYGLVDPTRVCNKITELRTERLAAQHSQVVFNEGAKPYQDVYFKESLKTFVQLPDGIALHYINYTRTSDLNGVERWVGSGKIRGSQEGMVDLLRARLGGVPGG
jgi:hypothetical protein